jgi:DNA-binding Lrp family transcriptional regulator
MMDDIDRRLLQLIQADIPVVVRPWAAIAARLGVGEADVLQRLAALKAARVIRQISAIFDTKSLGYQSTLVACQCDPAREAEAAAIINAHPGVSHNYHRDHPFNLWYTLAVAPTSRLGLSRTLDILHRESGARSTRPLPTLQLFKIGVELDVAGTSRADDKTAAGYRPRPRAAVTTVPVNIPFVREMQRDLPLEPEPFGAVAGRLGISLEELRRITAQMKATGQLRRVSAVLRHREIGFRANGMAVWAVPGDDADVARVGEQMAAYRAVTHCYRRPTYPDWPYNLFTMIHARSRQECEAVVAAIAQQTGITTHEVLYSTTEYKKTRVQYFTEAEAAWEAAHGAEPASGSAGVLPVEC